MASTGQSVNIDGVIVNYGVADSVTSTIRTIATRSVEEAKDNVYTAINDLNSVNGFSEYVGRLDASAIYDSIFEEISNSIADIADRMDSYVSIVKEYETSKDGGLIFNQIISSILGVPCMSDLGRAIVNTIYGKDKADEYASKANDILFSIISAGLSSLLVSSLASKAEESLEDSDGNENGNQKSDNIFTDIGSAISSFTASLFVPPLAVTHAVSAFAKVLEEGINGERDLSNSEDSFGKFASDVLQGVASGLLGCPGMTLGSFHSKIAELAEKELSSPLEQPTSPTTFVPTPATIAQHEKLSLDVPPASENPPDDAYTTKPVGGGGGGGGGYSPYKTVAPTQPTTLPTTLPTTIPTQTQPPTTPTTLPYTTPATVAPTQPYQPYKTVPQTTPTPLPTTVTTQPYQSPRTIPTPVADVDTSGENPIHVGGEYGNDGYTSSDGLTGMETSFGDALSDLVDDPSKAIDEILRGKNISIPTSHKPITNPESGSSSSVIPIAAGFSVASAAGLGAKAYLDHKHSQDGGDDDNEEDDDFESFSSEGYLDEDEDNSSLELEEEEIGESTPIIQQEDDDEYYHSSESVTPILNQLEDPEELVF